MLFLPVNRPGTGGTPFAGPIGYQFVLREALDQAFIDSTYNIVLFDCPPFLGAVTMNALAAADMLIIPTQPEYFSVHSLRTMMAL